MIFLDHFKHRCEDCGAPCEVYQDYEYVVEETASGRRTYKDYFIASVCCHADVEEILEDYPEEATT